MNRSRLYVNGFETPIAKDIPIPTSFLIKDIREPFVTSSDRTLTLEIPSTKVIDEIFEFCFDVNISLQSFNPNLNTPVKYYINEDVVLQGSLQLTRIKVNRKNGNVTYICNIKGQLTDLFYSIGEKYLTGNDDTADDLDFSDYDHILNYNNVTDTWDPAVSPNTNIISGSPVAVAAGLGYRYALIDNGLNEGDLRDYTVSQQRPVLFAYEYLLKIFQMAGKTWTSTFLDSALFKSLVIPCTEVIKTNETELADQQVLAAAIGVTAQNNSLAYGGAFWHGGPNNFYVVCDDDSTPPYNDDGSQYSTITGELTVGITRPYKIIARMSITIDLVLPPLATVSDGWDMKAELNIEKWNGSSWVIANFTGVITESVAPGVSSHFIDLAVQYDSITGSILAGDKFRVNVITEVANCLFKDGVGNPITTGSAGFDTYINTDQPSTNTFSRLELTLLSDNLKEGDLLELNRTIPKKIKQKDFFKSIVKAFNLYILPDKNKPNNFFIEPYIDFYTGTFRDWTDKLDITSETEIVPMSEIDSKLFTYRYKTDQDYYNKSYQDSWGEPYGQKVYENENVFVTGDKVNELIFSPTPLVGNGINGLIIPKIYKNENSVIGQMKTNIRLLYWGGNIGLSFGDWRLFKQDGTSTTWGSFPYAGHLDNPYTPSFDLSFGVPAEVYYASGPLVPQYTTDNLFNIYHKPFILWITDKNSKMVIEKLNLDEIDINSFDFREQIYIDGAYYVVNAINNFDNLEYKTTSVELLKLLR